MDRKIILFDIDDTLVDVHNMADKFYREIANITGCSLEQIADAKEKYKSTLEKYSDYHPNKLMDFIHDFFKVDESKKTNPFLEEKYYLEALFPETKGALEKLKEKYRLGIFSEGFDDYQKRKILALKGLLDEDLIFISRRKLDENFLSKLPKGSIIIDDRKEVVENLKNLEGIGVFWINRKDDEKMEGVETVKSLKEFADLL